ncbi:MAG: WD40 repeat domain-containing protein [Planctomycetia bacterium]|nr:WD40 repeat domain-containing protein [Planctomycetia bacterium]
MRPLVGHTKDVRAVAYCPDGRLVSGGSDRTVRFWDLTTGETIHKLSAKTPIYAIAVSPQDGTIAYSGRHPGAESDETPIRTYHLDQHLTGYTFRCPSMTPPPDAAPYYPNGVPRSLWSLSYSADGQYLAAAGRVMGGGNSPVGGGGHWFRSDNAAALGPLATARAFALRFAPDGHRLAVTGDGSVEFYAHPMDQAPVISYPLQSQWAGAVAFVSGTPNAVVGVNSALYFVDAKEKRKPFKVKTGFRAITAIAPVPNGRAVIVGGRPEGVDVYDSTNGALMTRYDFGLGTVHAVATAPDGLTFAVAGDDGLALFDWDL